MQKIHYFTDGSTGRYKNKQFY